MENQEEQPYEYIGHLMMTLHLVEVSFHEIEILTKDRPKLEMRIVGSKTFNYYTISLNYMFVNEICKLFESNNKRNQNVASLFRWTDHLKSITKDPNKLDGINRYIKILDDIKNSEEFDLIKTYRNSRFSHIDGDTDPFNFPVLGKENLTPIKEMLKSIKSFVDFATSIEGPGLIYDHVDDRTNNFIVFHSKLWEERRKRL